MFKIYEVFGSRDGKPTQPSNTLGTKYVVGTFKISLSHGIHSIYYHECTVLLYRKIQKKINGQTMVPLCWVQGSTDRSVQRSDLVLAEFIGSDGDTYANIFKISRC